MDIKKAKYVNNSEGEKGSITVELNKGFPLMVPLTLNNSDYVEIMRQVDAGELTIEPADENDKS